MSATTHRLDSIFIEDRPWGRFEQFVSNEQVSVKVLTVTAGQRLSLQRHQLRDEMWQVLDAPLDVEVDERRWSAGVGERVWIPRGATHRLGNSGAAAARVLEVAFGHFDEADIERFDDDYNRESHTTA